ncbi:MAG: dihydrolipoyl dehydrogenase [Treponema sp. GWB1_62_6]|nr:MAG: dihydrolipoyl dehydrogenase [Treponema sp. GWA1_62_8]OHE63953.1 MAG: dihydrolipoyl dehydrogenase [Treponema sp. GWC1_61_84]OHE67246.1 MAG: dihydrolipoyl dehydrogenase [Treponema sp. GWB1_62_6]HCM25276.1 dihydrolipoyl dehydrogenase [Treponema sp.]
MSEYEFDVVFVGAGPGGYVGAIRARQLGLRTLVVEKEKAGGVCLNIGCIPSKALIDRAAKYRQLGEMEEFGVAVDRTRFDYSRVQKASRTAADRLSKGVDFLLRKNGVEFLAGTVQRIGSHEVAVALTDGDERTVNAACIVVATGSRPRVVPGFEFDEKRVLSSTGMLMMTTLPKRLAILGAGAIGMEFAFIMNSFGVEVVVVEMLDRILPMEDSDAAALARSAFEKRGVRFMTSMKAFSLERGKGEESPLLLALGKAETSEPSERLETDAILVSVGRQPNTEGLGLESIGVVPERGGFLSAGPWYETDAAGVYAIGDVVRGDGQLAHVASAQAEIVAERIAFLLGKTSENPRQRLDPMEVPSAVYCEPQVAGFGPREDTLKAEARGYKAATFPFRGAGKAVAIGETEGFVKILYDEKTREIIGATVAGKDATELVHELLLAASSELVVDDVFSTVHAHPTLSEAVKEAALAAAGRAIHM